MASYKIHLLSAVLCCLAVLGQTDEVNTLKDATATSKIDLATEATEISVKTPEVDTPPSAGVTVEKRNTTTTSTTTTTTTTTTPAPTTPKPPGPPELGTWTYTNATSNVTCIVVQFAATLHITYNMALGNETHYGNVTLNVPTDAVVVDGACGVQEQWLNISWPNDTNAYSIGLHFQKDTNKGLYYLHHLNVSIVTDAHTFPNASSPLLEMTHANEEWGVATTTSYRCIGGAQLSLSEDKSGAAGTLALTRLQEQAFREGHDSAFSSARDCGGGDVPDAVPIAVGCALGGLVVVVLIAYLVGRRRSAARGYLSM